VSAAAAADKCPQTTVGKLFYRLVVFDYLLEIAVAALVPFLKVSIRRCIARCSQDDAVAKALQKAKDTDAQDLDPEQRELLRVCLTFFSLEIRIPARCTMHAGPIWVMTIREQWFCKPTSSSCISLHRAHAFPRHSECSRNACPSRTSTNVRVHERPRTFAPLAHIHERSNPTGSIRRGWKKTHSATSATVFCHHMHICPRGVVCARLSFQHVSRRVGLCCFDLFGEWGGMLRSTIENTQTQKLPVASSSPLRHLYVSVLISQVDVVMHLT
jgi:hypothetical protein